MQNAYAMNKGLLICDCYILSMVIAYFCRATDKHFLNDPHRLKIITDLIIPLLACHYNLNMPHLKWCLVPAEKSEPKTNKSRKYVKKKKKKMAEKENNL